MKDKKKPGEEQPIKHFIMIHDLPAGDGSGRTIREANLAKIHQFPLGALVELDTGVRMFIATHDRDCDGSPLYRLTDHLDISYPTLTGRYGERWISHIVSMKETP